MSLARALTTRRNKPSTTDNAYLGRAASQRAPNAKPIKREEISLPVELLSSTNVLAYEAPNIPDAPNARDRSGRYFNPSTLSAAISVTSSVSSDNDNDSDNTASDHSHDTDATSIDLSSPETSHDQFSHFGKNAFPKSTGTVRSMRSTTSSQASSSAVPDSPSIPARAASHTRRAHVLSHTRSVLSRESPSSKSGSTPTSPSSSSNRHDSADMFNSAAINKLTTITAGPASSPAPTAALPVAPPPPPPAAHPFGKELEQLNEAAEEFGNAVRDAEADADAQALRSRGLMRFCAADYLEEIAGLSPFAGTEPSYQHMAWI